jgi:hypothetical protein
VSSLTSGLVNSQGSDDTTDTGATPRNTSNLREFTNSFLKSADFDKILKQKPVKLPESNKQSTMSDQASVSIFSGRRTKLSSEQSREMRGILNPNFPRYELNGKISAGEHFRCFSQTQSPLKPEGCVPDPRRKRSRKMENTGIAQPRKLDQGEVFFWYSGDFIDRWLKSLESKKSGWLPDSNGRRRPKHPMNYKRDRVVYFSRSKSTYRHEVV